MPLSLEKVGQAAPELLAHATNAADAINASPLRGQLSKVVLCLDYSGSMRKQYKNGAMQRLTDKILGLGTQLDDNGAIDLFVFDAAAAEIGEVTLKNFRGAIDRLVASRRMGTTNYAGAIELIDKKYRPRKTLFGKKGLPEPTLVLFLTDGAPDSKPAAVRALTAAASAPIFFQFLSIGDESIPFLQKLDDLENRFIDNADYKPVGDVDRLTDVELFAMLLDEYPAWVAEMRSRGQIL